jgi:hypothetical protein
VRRLLTVAAVTAVALAAATSASAATRECEGLMVCVPRAGPWVVVPTGGGVPRPKAEWQLSCPKGYIVGGLDAELSQRAIDVWFLGMLGSPVNPGVTTARAVVFAGSYVGATARSPSFRPHVGCMPASGAGSRVPTAAGVVPAGHPTVRRVRTVRVRPGTSSVTSACGARERLVDATYAFGFYTRTSPNASLAGSVSGSLAVSGNRAVVTVRGDAEISSARAAVQVQAVCTRLR